MICERSDQQSKKEPSLSATATESSTAVQTGSITPRASSPGGSSLIERVSNATLWAGLICSMAVWLVSLRVPLWLDETISFWQTEGGFRQLWDRQGSIMFVAYPFVLWLTKTVFGSSVIALRAPSVLAMMGAAFFLYKSAREFFARDIALIVTTIFCLHPVVIFAAIDARAYAMGILACTAATYCMLRWTRTHQTR